MSEGRGERPFGVKNAIDFLCTMESTGPDLCLKLRDETTTEGGKRVDKSVDKIREEGSRSSVVSPGFPKEHNAATGQSIGREEGVHHPRALLNRMPLLDGVHFTESRSQPSCICHSDKRSVIESRLGAAE